MIEGHVRTEKRPQITRDFSELVRVASYLRDSLLYQAKQVLHEQIRIDSQKSRFESFFFTANPQKDLLFLLKFGWDQMKPELKAKKVFEQKQSVKTKKNELLLGFWGFFGCLGLQRTPFLWL